MQCWQLYFSLSSIIFLTRAADPSFGSSKDAAQGHPLEPRRNPAAGQLPKHSADSTSSGRSNRSLSPPRPDIHAEVNSAGGPRRSPRNAQSGQGPPPPQPRTSQPADQQRSRPANSNEAGPSREAPPEASRNQRPVAPPPRPANSGSLEPSRRWGRPEIAGSVRGPAYIEESKNGKASLPRYIPPGQRRYVLLKNRNRVDVTAQTISERHEGRRVRGKASFIATSSAGGTRVKAITHVDGHGTMSSAQGAAPARHIDVSPGQHRGLMSFANSISSLSIKGDAFVVAGAKRENTSSSPTPPRDMSREANNTPRNWALSSGESSSSSEGSTPRHLQRIVSDDSSATTSTATTSPGSSRPSSPRGSPRSSRHPTPPASPFISEHAVTPISIPRTNSGSDSESDTEMSSPDPLPIPRRLSSASSSRSSASRTPSPDNVPRTRRRLS